MRIRLFGAPAVVSDSVQPVTPPRQRAVLARLALDAGRAVSAERLLDDVWGEDRPGDGVKVVAFQISKLRDLLEPGRAGVGEAIETDPAGYRLAINRDDVDVHRFERLIAVARASGADPAEARRSLEEALSLWIGDPFAGVDERPWLTDEVSRLTSLRFLAEHTLAQHRIAAGDYATAIGDLEALIRREPLEEGLVADLMQALSNIGRVNDALRAYAELRRRLADELGIEPSGALQALELDLLGQRPASRPVPLERVDTTGNIGAQSDSFVGRAQEIAAIESRLADHRILTIAGAGGSGKTRLASEAALRGLGERFDAVWMVLLAPVTDGAQVLQTIASTLGLHAGDEPALTTVVHNYLRATKVLLILDNCEHVLDAVATAVESLVQAAPDLRILATSRESLGLAGEDVLRLSPLPIESAAPDDSAPALFRDRAQVARSDYADVEDADTLITTICERVAGIPLAIELAAARVRSLTLAQLADRLLSATGPSAKTKRGTPRHKSIEATIAWSVNLLEPATHQVFTQLSVFAGGFDLDAVEAVCKRASQPSALACLDQLVDKSLVDARGRADGSLRFELLEPIRRFAETELIKKGGLVEARAAHAEHYLDRSFEWERALRGPGQGVAIRQIVTEWNNITAAHATLHDVGRHDDDLDLAWNLFFAWRAIPAQQRGLHLALAALSNAGVADTSAAADDHRTARAWYQCTVLGLDITLPAAIDYADRGLEIAHRLGDNNLIGRLLMIKGCAVQHTSDRTDGLAIFSEGDALYQAHPEPYWWGSKWENAWFDLIRSAFGPKDDLELCRKLTTAAADAFEELGDAVNRVFALMVSAWWGMGSEHQDFVEQSLSEGLALARQNDLGTFIGHVALYQAIIAATAGDMDKAAPLLAEALHHLGQLPPEVQQLIDPTVAPQLDRTEADGAEADGAEPGAPRPAMRDSGLADADGLAATLSGAAPVVANQHRETADRLRKLAQIEEKPCQ